MVSESKADGTFRGWNRWLESGGQHSRAQTLYSWQSLKFLWFQALFLHIWLVERARAIMPAISDIVLMVVLRTELAEALIRRVTTIVPDSSAIFGNNEKISISKRDNPSGVLMVKWGVGKPYQSQNSWLCVRKKLELRAHTSTTKFDPRSFLAVDCSPAGDVAVVRARWGRNAVLLRSGHPSPRYEVSSWQRLKKLVSSTNITESGTDWATHLKNGSVRYTASIGVCALYPLSPNALCYLDDFLNKLSYKP